MPARTTHTLVMERTFSAAPAHVWAAWTDPKRLCKWFSPFPGQNCEVHEADVRPGGRYKIAYADDEGRAISEVGAYRTVKPPHELVFTLDREDDRAKTLVHVRLEPAGTGTRMLFEQSGFPSAAAKAGNKEGWTACFAKLADVA